MSAPAKSSHSRNASHASVASSSAEKDDGSQVTFAAFSPSSSHSPLDTRSQRSTILIQQKSPLLIATPPQITRALAYSYPFIRPLNKLVGLLSWTSDDPWESFLLVAAFWAITLYGDVVIRWVGPLSVIIMLMFAMSVRRYSLLSSTEWTGEKRKTTQKGGDLQDNAIQHKSLEDVVENLRLFTSRCNILLDPFLKLTDFLSTQTTATSATTRPALTAMFIRIFLVTPLWMALTLPPLYIVTTKRVVLAVGTTVLTWHSQPARVTRTIFWRSKLFRRLCTVLTGLDLSDPLDTPKQQFASRFNKTPHDIAAALAAKRGSDSPGIRFTFTLYENQRRWLGIGWTSSLLAYERSPWTDEHMNATSSTDKFELPEVTGGHARWEWAQGSEWHIIGKDGEIVVETKESDSDGGWIYYDNKWQNGRSGKDGWNRYTRRRKWCRDAELVEIMPKQTPIPIAVPKKKEEEASTTTTLIDKQSEDTQSEATSTQVAKDEDVSLSGSAKRRKGWFVRRSSQPSSEKSTALSTGSIRSTLADEEDDYHVPLQMKEADRSAIWGVGDDAEMSFG